MKALICTLYKILPSSGGQSIDSTFFVSIVAQYRSCTPELGGLFLLWFCGPGLRGGAQELAFPRLWVNSLLLSEPGIGDLNQEIG